MRPAPLCLLLLLAAAVTTAQTNLADVLGYAPGTRLLIIHADDLGMSHSVNEASFEAMTKGAVNSASVMMPTPWVPEAVAFAKTYPELDLGLHLTLTSEWTNYRWGPTGRDSVAGLLDADHYLHGECRPMAAKATVAEVERELRAQVEQALRLGLRPTHLDSHMGCIFHASTAVELGFFWGRVRDAFRKSKSCPIRSRCAVPVPGLPIPILVVEDIRHLVKKTHQGFARTVRDWLNQFSADYPPVARELRALRGGSSGHWVR